MNIELLKELTEAEYQLWKRQPISQILFAFLKERSDDWMEGAMDRWLVGKMELALDQEFRHKIQTCRELIDLKVDDIKTFYKMAGKLDDKPKQ